MQQTSPVPHIAVTMIDTSTGMVPKATADALDAGEGPLFDVLAWTPFFEYGWLICVPPADHDGTNQAVEQLGHAELANLLRYARLHGCDYLKLDADGVPVDGLPSFEW